MTEPQNAGAPESTQSVLNGYRAEACRKQGRCLITGETLNPETAVHLVYAEGVPSGHVFSPDAVALLRRGAVDFPVTVEDGWRLE